MSSPMSAPLHPAQILYGSDAKTRPLPLLPPLPACDHYAGDERKMRKALALQAELGPVFDLTCDCEDGAAAGSETAHAKMAAALIAGPDNLHGRVGARIHDAAHAHWRADMEILLGEAGEALAYLTLPKAEGAGDILRTCETLLDIAARQGIRRIPPLHVLIETHGALREVQAIAALPAVECLDFGLMDFVSGHRGAIPASAMKSPVQFAHPLVARAKCEIAAAAAAHGKIAAHNVTTALDDPQAAAADARRARAEFGFMRMWSIHPSQILPIVEAMRPDASEIEDAAAILAAAQDASWGPIRHTTAAGGELHDRASYRYYWDVLARAHATGAALPDAARRFFTQP